MGRPVDPTKLTQERASAGSFDHHAPELAADPWAQWGPLQDRCPVAWSNAHGGFWVVTRYSAVSEALRDSDLYQTTPSVGIPPTVARQVPLETEPALAKQLRRILTDEFSPAAVLAWEPTIRSVCDDLIDRFIEAGECDFVGDLGLPLSAAVILPRLGLGADRWSEFVDWSHKVVHELTSDPEGAIAAGMLLLGEITGVIESRLRGEVGDDLVSKLVAASVDGAPLSEELIRDYVMLLLFGGLDTTASALANALVRIAGDPALRSELCSRPDAIPAAVEEFLRIDAPVQAQARNLSGDVVMCEQHMRDGDRVLLSYAAANRDPMQFSEPDQVNIDRVDNRHLSFGGGLHRCLGANLGRAMFRVMLEQILTRVPDFELVGDPVHQRYPDVGSVYALRALPARFTPGTRIGRDAA